MSGRQRLGRSATLSQGVVSAVVVPARHGIRHVVGGAISLVHDRLRFLIVKTTLPL